MPMTAVRSAREETAAILARFSDEVLAAADALERGDPDAPLHLHDLVYRIHDAFRATIRRAADGTILEDSVDTRAMDEHMAAYPDEPEPLLEIAHSPLGRWPWNRHTYAAFAVLDEFGRHATESAVAALRTAATDWARGVLTPVGTFIRY